MIKTHIQIQYQVPIHVDPEELRRNLTHELSKITEFKGRQESFQLLEI
jgi:hypothetical protein